MAGGLGERLGYKGIKLALPSEIVTDTPYIQLYIQFILALQARARKATGDQSLVLPLAIMTSDDTDTLTQKLLKDNNNFGMTADQLIIFKQGKVPSLLDNDAHFTLEEADKYALDTKPHGHGDVHMLLYQNQIIQRWVQQLGRKHVVFFQDTNGLVFRAIPAALGVSVEKGLEMNSLTVPRVQGDAVGAICKLVREPGYGQQDGRAAAGHTDHQRGVQPAGGPDGQRSQGAAGGRHQEQRVPGQHQRAHLRRRGVSASAGGQEGRHQRVRQPEIQSG